MDSQTIMDKGAQKNGPAVSRRSFFGGLLAIGSAGMGALLADSRPALCSYIHSTPNLVARWSDVAVMEELLPQEKEPVRKTVTFAQRDGWREVDSAQSVYVSRTGGGQFRCSRPSVLIWGAAFPGRPTTTGLYAHAMAANSRQTGSEFLDRRRGEWIRFPPESRMASCKCTSSISVPTSPTRNR